MPNFSDLTERGYKKADEALTHTELILNSLGTSLYDLLRASRGSVYRVPDSLWNSDDQR